MDLQINDKRLNVAYNAVQEAGDIVTDMQETISYTRKDNQSIVTEADIKAEEMIKKTLREEYSYPVYGEESGDDIQDASKYWVTDPIDGTRNYSYGQPMYAIAVGLVEDGEVTVGISYSPSLDLIFYAVKDNGAYRNETEIDIFNHNLRDGKMYANITGYGKNDIIDDFNCHMQSLESAVLATGWVASGWCDIGVFGALAPWDMVAGKVLIDESGGTVLNPKTESTKWSDVKNGKVLVGNPEIVQRTLNELDKETIEKIQNTSYPQS